jgi:uncharacterized protein YktB (UPF0637 family)
VTDPLSGGAGWVGTGLLGSVLGWLLFIHLPNKDKQIAGLIESRDKLVKDLSAEFRASVSDIFNRSSAQDKERREDFKESLQKVVDHCEKEISMTSSYMRKDIDELSRLLTDFNKNMISFQDSMKRGT